MSNKKSTEPKASKKVVNDSNVKQSVPKKKSAKKDSQKLKEVLAWVKQSRSKSS